jgi:adenylate kinase
MTEASERPATARYMRVLLIGAPGSGKGTQAGEIVRYFGVTHISSGDLLRRHVAERTTIGRAVSDAVRHGDLVPDTIIIEMLREPLLAAAASGGYVLDGFPRTVEQAKTAREIAGELGVEAQVALHLDVPAPELVRRLLARRRGEEDTEDVIAHRIEVYEQKTLPMLDYYADLGILVRIDGARPPQEVTRSIIKHLESLRLD